MRTRILTLLLLATHVFAEEVIWSGTVSSDGTPSPAIPLTLHHQYQMEVRGVVNLEKWVQQGEKLANDGCFEFTANGNILNPLVSLRNSLGIPSCTGDYNPQHSYRSTPFTAASDRLHFWVYDSLYEDNSGDFEVKIIELPR